ncbi:MAG: class I SAM-dependent methyltransferase [Thalassobaculum sp.]
MFEAVGEKYWPAFFSTVADRLKSGGRAALQIITIDPRILRRLPPESRTSSSATFSPAACCRPANSVLDHAAGAGLMQKDEFGFGLDYARTLAEWRERFLASWPEIAQLGFDDRFKRMWLYYLAYCEGGFRSGNIDVAAVRLPALADAGPASSSRSLSVLGLLAYGLPGLPVGALGVPLSRSSCRPSIRRKWV